MRLAILAAVGATGWFFWPTLQSLADRLRLPEVQTTIVRAPAAAAAAAVSGTAANGYVVAERRAALSSDVPGRIVEMNVTEGSVVEKGFVVARLFSDEYRAALERADADLLVAKARVERAKKQHQAALAEERQTKENIETSKAQLSEQQAQRDYAAQEFARIDELVRQGINSPRDLQRAQSELDAAEARVRSLEAGLRSTTAEAGTAAARVQVALGDLALARAQVEVAASTQRQAKATLDKTDVCAPFDGVVVLKDAEVGEVVSPNSQGGSNARGAVCTMVDLDSLEIQANVPENALAAVRIGASADVFLDAFPDRRLPGKVDRIWPTADRQKATIEVRVTLLERSEHLRPEMGVRIVFRNPDEQGQERPEPTPNKNTVLVPEAAIVEAGGKTGTFVLERDTIRFVEVLVAERKSGRAAIESGLRPGQVLVLSPATSLRDGDRVRKVAQ